MQDAVAKVLTLEVGYHKSADVRLDIPEGGICFVFKPVEKCGDDLLLEISPRECLNNLLPVLFTQVLIPFTHYIESYA